MEGKIQLAIIKHLKSKGVFCWRQNNQGLYDRNLNNGFGGYRSSVYGMPGVADILGIMPDKTGRFLAVEVKTPKGRQSAEQVLFQKRVELAGGVYILARSVEDVDKGLLNSISR